MVKKTELKTITFKHQYFCDNLLCDGEVMYQNCKKLCFPALYVHKCNKCGEIIHFKGICYPSIKEEYVEVKDYENQSDSIR